MARRSLRFQHAAWPRLGRLFLHGFLVLLGLAALDQRWLAAAPEKGERTAAAADQPPERRLGRFIRIASPITDRIDNRVRLLVDTTIKEARKQGQWPVFVFEIQPGRTEIGQALDLARFLSSPASTGLRPSLFSPSRFRGTTCWWRWPATKSS